MPFHYTTGHNLLGILESGIIRPSTAFVERTERPCVWFSCRDTWEPVANKAWRNPDGTSVDLGKEGTRVRGGGLHRIGVAAEVAPHDWNAYLHLSGVKTRTAHSLIRAASARGSLFSDWRVTFDPVPSSQWSSIETEMDGVWVPFNCAAGVDHGEVA
jgi:hypothetical protein